MVLLAETEEKHSVVWVICMLIYTIFFSIARIATAFMQLPTVVYIVAGMVAVQWKL